MELWWRIKVSLVGVPITCWLIGRVWDDEEGEPGKGDIYVGDKSNADFFYSFVQRARVSTVTMLRDLMTCQ